MANAQCCIPIKLIKCKSKINTDGQDLTSL